MTSEEQEVLIEQLVSAWRPRTVHGELRPHAAWHDLEGDGRDEAFRRTTLARVLEAALDPEGLSTTARAVLARIRR